jgi:hypothetical protein
VASTRSDSSSVAEIGTSTAWSDGVGVACAGGSSRITCALVPPTPSALTPARLGLAVHSRRSVVSVNGLPSSWSAGFGSDRLIVGASSPCRSISATLIRPAIPAQLSRCPTFGFTEPSAHEPAGTPAKASRSASNSTGSPSAVPVPCAST